ncbi:MAG TPA: acyl-homoserine-lactone synthase [Rhizomicrobium sp.]|jgi:acyl-homoserine lactone synthase|nr:acyl-homoserine-lactone synthase [Rhizomicrobium sp.]
MLEVVTARNAHRYRAPLDEMFRMRHRTLVERRGLTALARPDGRLMDRFDGGEAIYMLLLDEDGTAIASQRLLPTTGPHLFSEVLQSSCDVRGVMRAPQTLELSRYCVDEERLGAARMELARKELVVGMIEFCRRAGYDRITMLLPADEMFHHLVLGIEIRPLGLPVKRDGIEQVAVAVNVTEDALNALRLAFDIFEPLVRYDGAPDGDPLVLGPARVPERSREAAE